MSLPVALGPRAQADLRDAFSWYEQQQAGLGRRCLADIGVTFRHIGLFPQGYQQVEGDVRAAPTHRFPYRVYYRLLANEVYVLGVLPDRTDPRHHQRRVARD